jgi:hypothetical protein
LLLLPLLLLLIPAPLSSHRLQFFFGAAIFSRLIPGSFSEQFILPCPFLLSLLLLSLPVTTLLGPGVVGDSVTTFVC